MPDLWVPENVQREQFVERQIALAQFWTKLVKSVDPGLSVVFVKDSPAAKAAKLEPGRWHVRRRNHGVPDSYMPITAPDGGYREPDSQVLEELNKRDLWRTPGGVEQFLRSRRQRQEQKDRAKALKREQLKDNMAEDFRAARRMPGENVDRKSKGRHGT